MIAGRSAALAHPASPVPMGSPREKPTTASVETLAFEDGLVISLARGRGTCDLPPKDVGQFRLHFQLHGEAAYGAPGRHEMTVSEFAAVLTTVDRGAPMFEATDQASGFALIVGWPAETLMRRLGVVRADVAKALGCAREGHVVLTPQMAESLRALETLNYDGLARRACVEARAVELTCALLAEVCKRGRPSGDQFRERRELVRIYRVKTHIDDHFEDKLDIAKLARVAGVSETTLARHFRETLGLTISEYLRRRRMEEAARLLSASHLSITQIAYEVGYEHPCNFSVAFRRHFNRSPRDLRRPASSGRAERP